MIIDRRDKRLAIDLFGSTSINQQPNPRTRFYGAVIFPFKSHCPESFRAAARVRSGCERAGWGQLWQRLSSSTVWERSSSPAAAGIRSY